MTAELTRRVSRLEESLGQTGVCPRCGKTADADELRERDHHGPEALAERRRVEALSPEEFREAYKEELGFYPGEWPPPAPDDELFQPECARCGNPTRPALTWGAVRALPATERRRLYMEAL